VPVSFDGGTTAKFGKVDFQLKPPQPEGMELKYGMPLKRHSKSQFERTFQPPSGGLHILAAGLTSGLRAGGLWDGDLVEKTSLGGEVFCKISQTARRQTL
jgi:hypothetical protein